MKKILIISDSRYEDPIIYDLHIFSEFLSLNDYDVHLIDPGNNIEIKEKFYQTNKYYKNAKVTFHPMYLDRNKPRNFFTKIIPNFLYVKIAHFLIMYKRFSHVRKSISKVKPDFIICYSVLRLGIYTLLLSFIKNIKVYFRFIDIFSQLRHEKSHKIRADIQQFFMINFSYKVIPMTKNYYDYAYKRRLRNKKINSFPFLINHELFHKNISRTNIHDINKTKLCFIGVFYAFSGVYEMVNNLKKKNLEENNIEINLYGDGEDFQRCKNLIFSRNLENFIKLHGQIDLKDLPKVINENDFGLNLMINTKERNQVFNAKIYQYFSCGLPVFSILRDSIEDIKIQNPNPLIKFTKYNEIPLKAKELKINSKNYKEMSENALEYINLNHSFEKGKKLLEQVLDC